MNNSRYKTWEKVFAAVIIIILIVVALVFLYYYLWFKLRINELKKWHNKNIEIELQNREENTLVFNEYIKNVYGIVAETFEVEIKSSGFIDTNFLIKTNFMDNPFLISVDTNDKTVGYDGFCEKLSTDPKFQHLYSEWVKKQVGIEDENVELEFSKSADVRINFDKIDQLSKDYREIFENTKNMELIHIFQYNISDLSRENWHKYASNYLKYFDKIKSTCNFTRITDHRGFLLGLYKYEQNQYNFTDNEKYYGTFDKPNNFGAEILDGLIYEDMAAFEQFEDGEIKQYLIDKNDNIVK